MKPIFLHSTLYTAGLVLACIPYAIAGLAALVRTAQARAGGGVSWSDQRSFNAINLLALAGVVLGFDLATHVTSLAISSARPLVFWGGAALMAVGGIVNIAAIWALGRSFTVQVATREGQRVIQSGPYRLVRHPAYSGQLLFFLGLSLTFGNWGSIPVALILPAIGYLYRIRVEEETLRHDLGEEYVYYMQRTHRLLPYLW